MIVAFNPIPTNGSKDIITWSEELVDELGVEFGKKASNDYAEQFRLTGSNITSGSLWVRRYDIGLVAITGFDVKFASTSNGTLLGTLPTQYRPHSNVAIPVYDTSNGAMGLGIQVMTDGKVYIRTYGGTTMRENGNYHFNTTYRI